MATFKAIVRTKRKDGFNQVYIRCVHNQKPGYIKTDKLVTDKQLEKNSEIRDSYVNEVATVGEFHEHLRECAGAGLSEDV